MESWTRTYLYLPILGIVILTSIGYTLFSNRASSQTPDAQSPNDPVTPAPDPGPTHIPIPDEVRALYWTAVTAGSDRGDELLEYMEETGINSVVIDLKMDNGEIAFEPKNEMLKEFAQDNPGIDDLESVLEKLAEKKIYRIARLAVMHDDTLAILKPEVALKKSGGGMWRDKIGSIWVDPAAPFVAEYALALAQEAYDRGFDEIQYDYIRFASDGALTAIRYPFFGKTTSTKVEVMEDFFSKVGDPLREQDIPVSFDLFGMTYVSTYDMEIGQTLPSAYPYADFFSPMVYPSHYPSGFRGFKNPAVHPYEIIKQTLDEGAMIMQNQFGVAEEESRPKARPWIQDFDIGAVYTSEMIEEQIRAVRDAGASGFLIWNARNVYEPANYLTNIENP